MAESGEEIRDSNQHGKPDVLRAGDIIPRAESSGEDKGDGRADIPRFNLAEDIMVQQRHLTAVRRKGPAGKARIDSPAVISPVESSPFEPSAPEWDPIVADIVARDIARLYGGKQGPASAII